MNFSFAVITFAPLLLACSNAAEQKPTSKLDFSQIMSEMPTDSISSPSDTSLQMATFGAGCFWCVEAVYLSLNGVTKVESGYSGGTVKNPSYKEVCTGRTGHAEVCQVTFDPKVISYATLLEAFFEAHDPTTLNRQGGDVGTQYRSVIYYHNDEQKRLAELAIKAAGESGNWKDPIVTELSPFDVFYKAEDYHQDYFALNGEQPYCRMVVAPKVEKFKKKFKDLLKK